MSNGDMTITVVTRWEGNLASMHAAEEGSRAARAHHEAWGVQNPGLLRPATGSGGLEVAFYTCDFPSMAAWGAFQDQVMASDWFTQLQLEVGAAHPDLQMVDVAVLYDAISYSDGPTLDRVSDTSPTPTKNGRGGRFRL